MPLIRIAKNAKHDNTLSLPKNIFGYYQLKMTYGEATSSSQEVIHYKENHIIKVLNDMTKKNIKVNDSITKLALVELVEFKNDFEPYLTAQGAKLQEAIINYKNSKIT